MIDFSFLNSNILENSLMQATKSLEQTNTRTQPKKATSKWMDVIEGWSKDKQASSTDKTQKDSKIAKSAASGSDAVNRTIGTAGYQSGKTDRYDEYIRQLQQFAGSQSAERVASSPWMEQILNMPNTMTTAQMEGRSSAAQNGDQTGDTGSNVSESDRRAEQIELLREFARGFGTDSIW